MAEGQKVLEVLEHPDHGALMKGLADWAGRRAAFMSLETPGRSLEGRAIPLARVSDFSVPDEDKQVVLITAIHAGREINCTNALLRLIKWLLSEDTLADNIRRNMVTLIMPCVNPDWYERIQTTPLEPGQSYRHLFSKNSLNGSDLYCFDAERGWTWDGPADPEKAPEASALFKVMEAYQPEAFLDNHGYWGRDIAMHYDFSGKSGRSFDSHTYCRELVEVMDREAERHGFPQLRYEDDSGRIKINTPSPERYHHYITCPRNYVYSLLYDRYHTLATINEMAFTGSGVIKARALLEQGLRVWRREFYPGFPVNQLGYSGGVALTAWGDTAIKRRRSRVELWNRCDSILFGGVSPTPIRGKRMGYCFPTPAAARRHLGDAQRLFLDDVWRRLEGASGVNTEYLRDFTADSVMEEMFGPGDEHKTMREGFNPAADAGEPIRHGLALRLLIPYDDARVFDVRVNGHEVKPSPTDGYQAKNGSGTVVQFNFPPGRAPECCFLTCRYETDAVREEGFGPDDWEASGDA